MEGEMSNKLLLIVLSFVHFVFTFVIPVRLASPRRALWFKNILSPRKTQRASKSNTKDFFNSPHEEYYLNYIFPIIFGKKWK